MDTNREGYPGTPPGGSPPGAEVGTSTSPLEIMPVLESLEAHVQGPPGEGVVIPHERFASFYHS